jgi:hypothetical protein
MEEKWSTNLPATIISLPSSCNDSSVGEADGSFSMTALIIQDEMSCGYLSRLYVCSYFLSNFFSQTSQTCRIDTYRFLLFNHSATPFEERLISSQCPWYITRDIEQPWYHTTDRKDLHMVMDCRRGRMLLAGSDAVETLAVANLAHDVEG